MKQISPQNYTVRSLIGAIVRFSVPLMLTGILQLLYNTADSIVVGRFAGSDSLAAVGSTTSLVFLLVTLFSGVSIGANFLAANYYGAQDEAGMFQTVHCAAVLSVILGVIASMVGLICSTPLLKLMHTDPAVLPLAVLYLRIYFLGTPALVVYNFGSALLRAVGDTTYPLLFMLVSGAVNVSLNLLLVIVFQMGVAGVAIATTVSQFLSAVMVTLRLCTIRSMCRLDLKKIRLYPDKAARMLKVGISAGLQGTIFSLANVMLQSQINTFGAAVMAGNSAASSLEGFIYVALNAFYQADITFTSQSLGAQKYKQIDHVFWICFTLSTVLGVILCAVLQIFRIPLLGLFIDAAADVSYAAVIAAGVARIMCIGRFQFVGGWMEIGCGTLRGMGQSFVPTVTTLVCACALRVVWIYTVFAYIGTLESLHWCFPLSWLLTFIIHCVCILHYRKKLYLQLST